MKAITLRSGREFVAPRPPLVVVEVENETTYQIRQEEQLEGEQPQVKKQVDKK